LGAGSAGIAVEGEIVAVVAFVGMGVVFVVDNALANDGHVTEGAGAGEGLVLVKEKLLKGLVDGEGSAPLMLVATVGAVGLVHVLSTNCNHDPTTCRHETSE
jgi:hypothetical protein